MAKSKHAPALFEVIQGRKDSKPSGKLAVPSWWRSGKLETKTKEASRPDTEPGSGGPKLVVAGVDESEPSEPLESGPVEAGATVYPPAPRLEPTGTKAADTSQTRQAIGPSALFRASVVPGTAVPGVGPGANQAYAEHPPLIRLNGGRVELSLNPVSAAVAVGVLLLALFTSFQLGSTIGVTPANTQANAVSESVVADSVEEALKRKPNAEVLNLGGTRLGAYRDNPASQTKPLADRTAGLRAVEGKPIPGRTYVILQGFAPDHKQSAESAQQWLGERGMKTMLYRSDDGQWLLISAEYFKTSAEYFPYIEKVKSLGKDLGKELSRTRLSVYQLTGPYAKKWK